MEVLERPGRDELVVMLPVARQRVAFELEAARARVTVELALLAADVDRVGGHVEDGHRSVVAWLVASCNVTSVEARRLVRLGRMLTRLPMAAEAAQAGLIATPQLLVLAAVVANPRVQEALTAEAEALLVAQAQVLHADDYSVFVHRWESLADQDGALDAHERADRERRLGIHTVGARTVLDGHGGVTDGVVLQQVLDAFAETEWQADWDAGVAVHGAAMCPALMARTDAQRRWDALLAMAHAATGGDGVAVTVNLVMGEERFEQHLTRTLGGTPTPPDPGDRWQHCETDHGVQVDPRDVLVAAMVGHVRRVVFDSQGVIVDMGRRQRLFNGPLREAVLLMGNRCVWPGCNQPAATCEADHVLPWGHDGPSSTANGAPTCGRHNRWRTNGYRTTRDTDGHWHHHRPDGTEIGWRAHHPTTAT